MELRKWNDLKTSEKKIALQELINKEWVKNYSGEILSTIEYLNDNFLRQCPGKKLHQVKSINNHRYRGYEDDSEKTEAAIEDFCSIFLYEKSDAMVLRMLTKFAESYINDFDYRNAEQEKDDKKREKYIKDAFEEFDRLTNCLNHIFEQFAVNSILTRNGPVPRQDNKITEEIYVPTLKVLADPKWKTVSDDLMHMFEDFREENYSETITKAHRAIQRFLQILVGKEGKNSKGELANLFREAKKQSIIPSNRFTEPIINVFQSFIPSERATKSTAKPSITEATSSDALLMMNIVMVFLQHCLQKNK